MRAGGSDEQQPYVSLIVPAYNEQERIAATLERILDYVRRQAYSWEILVVDDGSRDDTAAIAASFAPQVAVHSLVTNRGKGAAVRTGMLLARGRYRVFTDADLSTPIEELEPMLAAFERGADVVIGSRRLEPGSIKKHQPWYREIIGIMGNKLVQTLLLPGYEDTQCGFKGCTAEAAIEIFSRATIDGFAFDIEMIYLAERLGFRVEQIPVEWYNDERTRVRAVRDTLRTLRDVFAIRRSHRGAPIRS
ncbi:MAG: glycosyltransferase family 2 protein [Chlorobi bacterium]|nr:glycosyltransferase family 2 protein [Chlorobiota bacterium]